MKHAGPAALARLAPLLASLRKLAPFREPTLGAFYRGGSAFLHFHEDAAGDFADLKLNREWERSRVTTARERAALLRRVRGLLAESDGRHKP